MYHIVLDWEAAYADDYFVEVRSSPHEEWKRLYNGKSGNDRRLLRRQQESGQSPGVSYKLPLHITHSIDLSRSEDIYFRYLRLLIERPAAGWGVSLWQVDVYGNEY